MRNKKPKMFVAVIFILATTISLSMAYASYTPSGTLTKVYSGYTHGSVYAHGLSNTAGCSSSLIHFHPDNTDVDKVYKVLMTGLTSQKKGQV